MNAILDANILVRTTDPTDSQHSMAKVAVTTLRTQGYLLCIVPQSLYEFWVVATRPKDKNGLGLSADECVQEIKAFKSYYPLLLDQPTIYSEWETLVSLHACCGKVAHDARYVAAMKSHGIAHLVTFNSADFVRYPGIVVHDPRTIAATPSE